LSRTCSTATIVRGSPNDASLQPRRRGVALSTIGMNRHGGRKLELARIRLLALSAMSLTACQAHNGAAVALQSEVRKSPLQVAVEASSHWAELRAAAHACPRIAPLVEWIRDGLYERAWYEHRWPEDQPTPACAVAYDKAWNILWPVSRFLREDVYIFRIYPWLQDPIVEMAPRRVFEPWLKQLRTVCTEELEALEEFADLEERLGRRSCDTMVSSFEQVAKGTAYSGAATRLHEELAACHSGRDQEKCK
jgi:hypothetical protein